MNGGSPQEVLLRLQSIQQSGNSFIQHVSASPGRQTVCRCSSADSCGFSNCYFKYIQPTAGTLNWNKRMASKVSFTNKIIKRSFFFLFNPFDSLISVVGIISYNGRRRPNGRRHSSDCDSLCVWMSARSHCLCRNCLCRSDWRCLLLFLRRKCS